MKTKIIFLILSILISNVYTCTGAIKQDTIFINNYDPESSKDLVVISTFFANDQLFVYYILTDESKSEYQIAKLTNNSDSIKWNILRNSGNRRIGIQEEFNLIDNMPSLLYGTDLGEFTSYQLLQLYDTEWVSKSLFTEYSGNVKDMFYVDSNVSSYFLYLTENNTNYSLNKIGYPDLHKVQYSIQQDFNNVSSVKLHYMGHYQFFLTVKYQNSSLSVFDLVEDELNSQYHAVLLKSYMDFINIGYFYLNQIKYIYSVRKANIEIFQYPELNFFILNISNANTILANKDEVYVLTINSNILNSNIFDKEFNFIDSEEISNNLVHPNLVSYENQQLQISLFSEQKGQKAYTKVISLDSVNLLFDTINFASNKSENYLGWVLGASAVILILILSIKTKKRKGGNNNL